MTMRQVGDTMIDTRPLLPHWYKNMYTGAYRVTPYCTCGWSGKEYGDQHRQEMNQAFIEHLEALSSPSPEETT